MSSDLPEHVRVAVIGAGYAGLSTALTLADRGVEALVLEANDRPGGRIFSQRLTPGGVVDHGGQWVGPTQTHLLEWSRRFSCTRFDTWDTGNHLDVDADGTIRRYATGETLNAPGAEAYAALGARLDEFSRAINVQNPPESPDAEALDSQTVASWLSREVTDPDARRRFALAVQGVWSVEPRDLSMLHLLFYIASAGSFDQLMETRGCAQDQRFIHGAQAPALAAASQLASAIRYNAAVHEVRDTGDEYRLSTAAGTVAAQRVVVAVPPGMARPIRFEPGLPVSKRRWLEKSTMGDVAKLHIVYREPFWRHNGDSGQAALYSDASVGVIFDNSPADEHCGVLTAFIYGDRLRRWASLTAEDRRTDVVATLVGLFGDLAAAVENYTEMDWTQTTYAGGGYAAVPAPGAWIEHGQQGWRAPVGRIHWAGTETASHWHGYIDGAISSGERAAREILAADNAG